MDPRDALRHVQSIVLYTKLDAECDQQVTVVARRSTADNIGPRPPSTSVVSVNNSLTTVSIVYHTWLYGVPIRWLNYQEWGKILDKCVTCFKSGR